MLFKTIQKTKLAIITNQIHFHFPFLVLVVKFKVHPAGLDNKAHIFISIILVLIHKCLLFTSRLFIDWNWIC